MNEDELTQEDIDAYNQRRQKEYDEYTKGNEALRRRANKNLTDDQIREKVQKEDAQRAKEGNLPSSSPREKKKQQQDMEEGNFLQDPEEEGNFLDPNSGFRTTLAIGTEVGLNTILDLFSADPTQLTQIFGAQGINALAQRIRGGEFSRGEMIASGLASLIPGGAQAKSLGGTIGRTALRGGVSGAIETGAADLIDTGEIDAENVATGFGVGTAFGGLFGVAAGQKETKQFFKRLRARMGSNLDPEQAVFTPEELRAMGIGEAMAFAKPTEFSNNPPKNPREWIYKPPDATQTYKINQTLLNNAVLDNGTFSTKLYESGKVDSKWGRMIGINYQTNPNTRVGWDTTKRELRHTWEGLYGAAMKRNGYTTKDIQIEHIFTIQQSMPIYEGVRFGSDLYNQIQERILKRGYDPGNTDRNLMAILPHLHQQKTNYFNALHGKDGRKFFTQDMIDEFAKGNNKFRFEMLDKYLDEIDQGKKILDDAIEVFDSLNVERGYMPEEIAERLGQIELNKYSAPELKKIFSDMEAEGFRLDPKQSAKAETTEIKAETKAAEEKAKKQKQLDKDDASVEKVGEAIDKFVNKNLNKFPKTPYALGMKDEALREKAEQFYETMRKNRLIREDIQGSIFDEEAKERFIQKMMKSILKQQRGR